MGLVLHCGVRVHNRVRAEENAARDGCDSAGSSANHCGDNGGGGSV
jgi:hypothetical protein